MTPPSREELLPCPFCGVSVNMSSEGSYHQAVCQDCGSKAAEYPNETLAALAWNTRSAVAQAPASEPTEETRFVTDEDREYASELVADLTNDDLPKLEIAARWFRKARVEQSLGARAAPRSSAQTAPSPTAEQLAVLVGYLESQSDRITKSLENPSWTPRRSHVEGDRNAFLAAANTLDQALRGTTVSSTPRGDGT